MLSITKCKKILGKDAMLYTDEEIIILRDVLYKIAELYRKRNQTKTIDKRNLLI